MVAIFRVNDRQRIIVRRTPRDVDDRFIDVGFETPDRDAARAWLVSHGLRAETVDEPGEGGGDSVETTDPDGHAIRLIRLTGGETFNDGADRRLARRILHAGLTVRDAAKADAFYKDVLGFSEIWRGGRTDATLNWINMRVPDGTDYVEYMLTTGPLDRRQLGAQHPGRARLRPCADAGRRSEPPRHAPHRVQPEVAAERLRSGRHPDRVHGAVDGQVILGSVHVKLESM
jgi:lactoylglutathione lyase